MTKLNFNNGQHKTETIAWDDKLERGNNSSETLKKSDKTDTSKQVKMNYKEIVRAIYDKAKEEKSDVRRLIREWIMLFESSRVVGWDRMKFLDYCVEESKRLDKEKEK